MSSVHLNHAENHRGALPKLAPTGHGAGGMRSGAPGAPGAPGGILDGAEILIAVADHGFQDRLGRSLEQEGCRIRTTVYPGMIARWAREGLGDAAILDAGDADTAPLWLLKQLAALRPGLPIIIFSEDPEKASRLREQGVMVWDCLPRPADPGVIVPAVAGVLETARSDPEGPAADAVRGGHPVALIGQSAAMRELGELVSQLANGRLPVLIAGESGSGRSLIARILHERSAARGQEQLVLLGNHELGSCEEANAVLQCASRGTLLIDEITELTPEAQVRAVRLIDLSDGGPRFIATACADPMQAVRDGLLRSDLYYRLAGAVLQIPPLRERIEDIPAFAVHFLEQAGSTRRLDSAAMALLGQHSWPGNLRELGNMMGRLALAGTGGTITADEVRAILGQDSVPPPPVRRDALADTITRHLEQYFRLHEPDLPPPGLHRRFLREVEAPLIRVALDATGGNQARCARILGINRNTLRKKIDSLDIEVTRGRKMM